MIAVPRLPAPRGALPLFVATLLLAMLALAPRAAHATPYYMVASAHACNTCHVEPIGWLNPEKKDRRCTLDCQGCHVSPTGGGLRTPLGEYYANEVLPMFGPRPSESADLMRHLQPGAPTEGKYSLFKEFEGWWPGQVSHRDIVDRYGDIDPDPEWQVGGDFRLMSVVTTAPTSRTSNFPMEMEAYAAYHWASNMTAYADLGLQGRQSPSDKEDFLSDRFWVRELFVMIHDLPGSQYVRAGRFFLPYGWRISDHTAYTRRETGFDQDRQAYGVEWGQAYYEWWSNASLWYQGLEGWPGEKDALAKGYGTTMQGGWRGMGFMLGGSLHAMWGDVASATGGTSTDLREAVLGPMWSVNLFPVVYLGELDFHRDGNAKVNQLAAMHELQYHGLRGLIPKARYEWLDQDIEMGENVAHRMLLGFEFNPYKRISFDTIYRKTLNAGAPDTNQWLMQLHLWY